MLVPRFTHPEGVVGVVVWQGRGHWKDKMIFFELGLGTITHQMISSYKSVSYTHLTLPTKRIV